MHQINELHQFLGRFFNGDVYELISDYDENYNRYGLRVLMTAEIPQETGIIVGDIVHNLRSSLEHVASDLFFYANGSDARQRSKFPMHETDENLFNALERYEIKDKFPNVISAIRDAIRPTRSGNKLVWASGRLWNIDKHRIPIISYAITQIDGIEARGRNENTITASVAVEQGRCFGIVSSDAPLEITNSGDASFSVQFDEIGLFEGDPLVPTLCAMHDAIGEAITIIEQAYETDIR